MIAWAFNEEQLRTAIEAWAESMAGELPDSNWLVEDLQRDTDFITLFLRSEQAAKLRIAPYIPTTSRTVLDPQQAWPFPEAVSDE